MIFSYYLCKKGVTLPLGEISYNKKAFYVEDGWLIFNEMVNNNDQTLNNYKVVRSDKKQLSIEEFLDEIKNYIIII